MDNKQYNALFSFIWNIANDVLVHAFEVGLQEDYSALHGASSHRRARSHRCPA